MPKVETPITTEDAIAVIRRLGIEDQFATALVQVVSEGYGKVFQDGVITDLGDHGIDGPELVLRLASVSFEQLSRAYRICGALAVWEVNGEEKGTDWQAETRHEPSGEHGSYRG